jgi:hypothetical protein
MAKILLHRHEVEDRALPFVCLKCGRAGDLWKTKRFLLASPSPVGNVGKLTLIEVPLCSAHKNHWFWRGLFGWGVGGVLVALFLPGFFAIAEHNQIPAPWRTIFGVALGVGFFGLILWLPVMLVLHFTSVRPSKITEDDITLVGVSPVFVTKVKEYRRLPAEERKVARRAGRKRGRDLEG